MAFTFIAIICSVLNFIYNFVKVKFINTFRFMLHFVDMLLILRQFAFLDLKVKTHSYAMPTQIVFSTQFYSKMLHYILKYEYLGTESGHK